MKIMEVVEKSGLMVTFEILLQQPFLAPPRRLEQSTASHFDVKCRRTKTITISDQVSDNIMAMLEMVPSLQDNQEFQWTPWHRH